MKKLIILALAATMFVACGIQKPLTDAHYTSDIAGAKAAGIDQVWITSEGVKELRSEGVTATYIVPKLTDVITIV